MRKLITEKGSAIVASMAVAFAAGYGLVHAANIDSFMTGFAAGVGATIAFTMWFDE